MCPYGASRRWNFYFLITLPPWHQEVLACFLCCTLNYSTNDQDLGMSLFANKVLIFQIFLKTWLCHQAWGCVSQATGDLLDGSITEVLYSLSLFAWSLCLFLVLIILTFNADFTSFKCLFLCMYSFYWLLYTAKRLSSDEMGSYLNVIKISKKITAIIFIASKTMHFSHNK